MGLAASQARYLTLTARKSDLEYQSQTINSRRIQLSYKTAEIARAYSEGMNNKVIKMQMAQLGTDGNTTKTWKELTFENLLASGEYMIIGTGGAALEPNPYNIETVNTEFHHKAASAADHHITADAFGKLSTANQAAYRSSVVEEVKDEDGKVTTPAGVEYVLKDKISDDVYKKLTDATVKGFFDAKTEAETTINYKFNPKYYTSKNAMDLQSLLVSGKAQIVSKAFFDYMVNHGGYSYEAGLSESNRTYQSLLDEWESNDSKYNNDNLPSVIDWRSDETSTFAQKTYTEDDADVLAAYEAATAEVQAQDKMLEMEEKNIETQHKAIETELENIKKVVQKNIEETFKIFS